MQNDYLSRKKSECEKLLNNESSNTCQAGYPSGNKLAEGWCKESRSTKSFIIGVLKNFCCRELHVMGNLETNDLSDSLAKVSFLAIQQSIGCS